jgi:hypothetical protein
MPAAVAAVTVAAMVEGEEPKPDRVCENCRAELSGRQTKYCSDRCRNRWHLLQAYGLTPDDWAMLVSLTGGRCPICRRKQRYQEMAVEHRHSDGLVRGLACQRCNQNLAAFYENPEMLRRAADFLENPPAEKMLGRKVYVTDKRAGGNSRLARASRKRS